MGFWFGGGTSAGGTRPSLRTKGQRRPYLFTDLCSAWGYRPPLPKISLVVLPYLGCAGEWDPPPSHPVTKAWEPGSHFCSLSVLVSWSCPCDRQVLHTLTSCERALGGLPDRDGRRCAPPKGAAGGGAAEVRGCTLLGSALPRRGGPGGYGQGGTGAGRRGGRAGGRGPGGSSRALRAQPQSAGQASSAPAVWLSAPRWPALPHAGTPDHGDCSPHVPDRGRPGPAVPAASRLGGTTTSRAPSSPNAPLLREG